MALAKNKLTSPSIVIQILKQHNLTLTKTYGQHFLVDENIRRKIIEAAALNKDDIVLEVGPGIGTLSEKIAPEVKKLWLIELEKHFIPILKHTLTGNPAAEIMVADALKTDYGSLDPLPTKMVSNLPYNIAAPLIIKLLAECPSISKYTLMIPGEMGERLTAKLGSAHYSSLTLKISYLADVKVLFKVSNQVFLPKPKIKSVVIRIERHPNKQLDRPLFGVIEEAFRYRRKTIKNALLSAGFDRKHLDLALEKAQIEPTARPQNLTTPDFQKLAEFLNNHTRNH